MYSEIKEIGPVSFPQWTGERVYMVPFFQRDGLPADLKRWQSTVDDMLRGIRTERPIYIMIDQGEVEPGTTHRRGGPHIDGNWIAEISAHGNGGHVPPPRHRPCPGHGTDSLYDEALILASDVSASCAYLGEVDGWCGEGGDCSHLDLSVTERVRLKAGRVYAGNVTMIHESLPVDRRCRRTLVRLNCPGVVL